MSLHPESLPSSFSGYGTCHFILTFILMCPITQLCGMSAEGRADASLTFVCSANSPAVEKLRKEHDRETSPADVYPVMIRVVSVMAQPRLKAGQTSRPHLRTDKGKTLTIVMAVTYCLSRMLSSCQALGKRRCTVISGHPPAALRAGICTPTRRNRELKFCDQGPRRHSLGAAELSIQTQTSLSPKRP